MQNYILKDKKICLVERKEYLEFATTRANFRVAETFIKDIRISTVFLFYDHNYKGIGAPILFETMVFDPNDGKFNLECNRYCTWEEAEAGHNKMLELVKDSIMTTKQEIIEFIKQWMHYDDPINLYASDNTNECNKLIQMIEDLKPKVGKLEWQSDYINDKYIAQVSEIMEYKITNYKGQWTVNYDNSVMYSDLEYAKQACQKHYEETILGALEDYN